MTAEHIAFSSTMYVVAAATPEAYERIVARDQVRGRRLEAASGTASGPPTQRENQRHRCVW